MIHCHFRYQDLTSVKISDRVEVGTGRPWSSRKHFPKSLNFSFICSGFCLFWHIIRFSKIVKARLRFKLVGGLHCCSDSVGGLYCCTDSENFNSLLDSISIDTSVYTRYYISIYSSMVKVYIQSTCLSSLQILYLLSRSLVPCTLAIGSCTCAYNN